MANNFFPLYFGLNALQLQMGNFSHVTFHAKKIEKRQVENLVTMATSDHGFFVCSNQFSMDTTNSNENKYFFFFEIHHVCQVMPARVLNKNVARATGA